MGKAEHKPMETVSWTILLRNLDAKWGDRDCREQADALEHSLGEK